MAHVDRVVAEMGIFKNELTIAGSDSSGVAGILDIERIGQPAIFWPCDQCLISHVISACAVT